MIDDNACYPAEPGRETKLRYEKNRETTRGEEELTLEPLTVKVGDEVSGLIIEAIIGSGVTSTVFRVRERETGRRLAMKVLQTRSNPTLAASRMGFEFMSKLKHPSLVRLYRIVNVGKCIGFTMEEVVGDRLVDVLHHYRDKDRECIFELVRRLLRDLGSALETMHDAGYVHRDVKPDNIMIDKTGRVRLVDYGLIGTYDPVSDPDGRRNYLAGTYWYMAPESISEQMYPPACDVYALGCVILEMIADRSRLPKETIGESLGNAIGNVRKFLPEDTPSDLADLICDMLDPVAATRPIAARLGTYSSSDFSVFEAPHQYRRSRFRGREREMAMGEQWVHSVVGNGPKWLHISGGSGVGKTWFVAELLRRIRSNPWFQVFDTVCHERDDVSLHSFDSMADAIARRYSREDREPLKLSPKHALVLRQAFPSLRAVIVAPQLSDLEIAELQSQSELQTGAPGGSDVQNHIDLARSDALLSGVELVDQMCANGPLFLVYDDIHWADQDSINVLDKLLSDCKGEVGIITIGRGREDRFRKQADAELELTPLSPKASVELLQELLRVGNFRWDYRALKRLAALGEGNAYRLTQLAACISHDDPALWQERLLAGPIELEDIWNARLHKVSADAMKALEYLAISGGPTGPGQLACVSELMDRVDDSIQELLDLHLITESSGRDSIDVIHQRLSQRIIDRIDPDRFRMLHEAWAKYLVNRSQDQWKAAKIAGHLINAGQPENAIPFAIQAASDASKRFAFTEAGRWHQRVAELVPESEAPEYLQQALNCFESAGRPEQAVSLGRQLISLGDQGRASISLASLRQQLAANMLHSGEIESAIRVIESLAEHTKSETQAKDQPLVTMRTYRQFWRKFFSVNDRATPQSNESLPPSNDCGPIPNLLTLYRPFAIVDAVRASPFLLESICEPAHLRPEIQIQTAVDLAVMGCRQPGRTRKRNSARLQKLERIADQSPCPKLKGVVAGGIACRHLLVCDWASAITSADNAINLLRTDRFTTRFDDAYARLPLLWSYVWLGRLNDLRQTVNRSLSMSRELNDEYLTLIATTGVAGAASLIQDDVETHVKQSKKVAAYAREQQSPWLSVFHGFAPIMRMIYQGMTMNACRYHAAFAAGSRRSILDGVQMPKILELQFHGLIHLRLAFEKPIYRNESLSIVRAICESLRCRSVPYAKMLVTFFEAQSHELMANRDTCIDLYREAADAADSLDLVPFRLAALDRVSMVKYDKQSNELHRFLAAEGVRAPEKFARLYSGLS